jgi:hypothetical protein
MPRFSFTAAERQTIEEAMHLLMATSSNAFDAATKALKAVSVNSPITAERVRLAVKNALPDNYSREEMQLLSDAMLIAEGDLNRSQDVRVRVTPDEKVQVQQAAEGEGVTVSSYIRTRIGLDESF